MSIPSTVILQPAIALSVGVLLLRDNVIALPTTMVVSWVASW